MLLPKPFGRQRQWFDRVSNERSINRESECLLHRALSLAKWHSQSTAWRINRSTVPLMRPIVPASPMQAVIATLEDLGKQCKPRCPRCCRRFRCTQGPNTSFVSVGIGKAVLGTGVAHVKACAGIGHFFCGMRRRHRDRSSGLAAPSSPARALKSLFDDKAGPERAVNVPTAASSSPYGGPCPATTPPPKQVSDGRQLGRVDPGRL